jgi:hypothetical protein
MAQTKPQQARPEPDGVEAALHRLGGEATLGEVASELGVTPSAVNPALEKLAAWEVVEKTGAHRYELAEHWERDRRREFDDQASDVPCPSCGYRPLTARDAAGHLLAHLTGSHTTGEEQLRNVGEHVR